jgi:PASTA domain
VRSRDRDTIPEMVDARISLSMRAGLLFIASIVGLTACASGSSLPQSSSQSNDMRRMDVHPSMAAPTETEEETESDPESGPEPGEEFASPPAATIPPGTRIPDIRGMDFEDAVIMLRELGMDFGLVTARNDDEGQWTVIEQTPLPGSAPAADKRVSMVVSIGPEAGGISGVGGVACKPEEDDIDEPYCFGKLLKY